MDYKDIVKQQQDYCKCMSALKDNIIAWLEENIKKGDFLYFGDASFHVLDEDDEETKSSLCIGVGNSADFGGAYCRVLDGYELSPMEMDAIDLYNVAYCVNHIIATEQQKKHPHHGKEENPASFQNGDRRLSGVREQLRHKREFRRVL